MKPNMLKKWSVALLVAAGAAGLVGCNTDQGARKTLERQPSQKLRSLPTRKILTQRLTARSLSLVQAGY